MKSVRDILVALVSALLGLVRPVTWVQLASCVGFIQILYNTCSHLTLLFADRGVVVSLKPPLRRHCTNPLIGASID